jgi:hypothetical protein
MNSSEPVPISEMENCLNLSLRNLNSIHLTHLIAVIGIRFALERDKELKPQKFPGKKFCGLVLRPSRGFSLRARLRQNLQRVQTQAN